MAEEQKVIGIPKVTEQKKYETEKYQEIFTLVTEDDGENKKTMIAIGNSYIWRAKFDSVDDAKAFIDAKPWGLMVNTIIYIQEHTNQLLNN